MDIFYLPRELIGEVCGRLDVTSTHCLRRTCKDMRDVIPVRRPSQDWLEFCPYVNPDASDPYVWLTLYQAVWDEHEGWLDAHPKMCAGDPDLQRQLLYVAAMAGSRRMWEKIMALLPPYVSDDVHRDQCATVALGFVRDEFVTNVLKRSVDEQTSLMGNYMYALDHSQSGRHLKCPDPTYLLLSNGRMDKLSEWATRFGPQHAFHATYMRQCLIVGRPDLITHPIQDRWMNESIIHAILEKNDTLESLTWILNNQASAGFLRETWILANVIYRHEPPKVDTYLDWAMTHHCLTPDQLYDILKDQSALVIRFRRYLAQRLVPLPRDKRPAWAKKALVKEIEQIAGLAPEEYIL
jgi:hypothetical protein